MSAWSRFRWRCRQCGDPEQIDAHIIDWDRFLPRFGLFRKQEAESRERAGVSLPGR